MLKKSIFIIIAIFTTILFIFNTFSFAVNDVVNEEIISEESSEDIENEEEQNEIDKIEEEIPSDTEELDEFLDEENENNTYTDENNSDFYSIGKSDVTIDYPINGNVYIIANSVNISSEIVGDVFVIASSLSITEDAYVGNLFILGSDVNINGNVNTVYSCADTLTINKSAYIERDVYGVVNIFNIFGTIERNANITFDKIAFSEKGADENEHGEINGNLNYISGQQAEIEENSVFGDIYFNQKTKNSGFGYIKNLATFIITVVFVYLIIAWLTPKFKDSSKELLKNKLLPVLGFGALAFIIAPIAIIILMLLGITIDVAFALLAIYVFLLLISSSISIIALSSLIIEKAKIDIRYKQWGIVCLMTIATWAIGLIPIVGGLISIALIIVGMGLVIKSLKNK